MSRFIAIPVAQGDAFYLEREDFSVLVDGGRSRFGFPSMFQAVTKADGVSVLVCTHNDTDHASGILGFLEAGLKCDEVWLPGRWLAALKDVLNPFVEVYDKLAGELTEMDSLPKTKESLLGISPIEAYAESLRGPLDDRLLGSDEHPVEGDGWPESYIRVLEQAEAWERAPWFSFWLPDVVLQRYFHYRHLEPVKSQLLWSAIDAASRIRAIAIEAFHRGIPVRWFEFAPHTPRGGVTALKPINAKAITRVRPRVGRLLDFLALTVSNKESLVFWSPPTKQHPGVLFNADSDLAGVSLPSQLHGALSTAPHHGSEENANAYSEIGSVARQDFSSITWIRSDGRYRKRPGSTYLGLSSRRLCTICRLGSGIFSPKHAVHLFSRRGVWTRHQKTVVCSCR